jgi:hypothetical protein
VTSVAYIAVPCAPYGFNDVNPAPDQTLHCDYGPLKTTTLINPSPAMAGVGMSGLGATVTVALGSPGSDAPRVQPSTASPPFNDFGSFRTQCGLATFAFDDPIVYPGQPGASHLHMFFGNTGINARSTSATLVTSGNSTCRGGTLNRTAYWVPALFDTRTGEVLTPDEATIYYKSGYAIDYRVIQSFPAGLRMIAGDKASTGKQEHISWRCACPCNSRSAGMASISIRPTTRVTWRIPTIATRPSSAAVRRRIPSRCPR